MLTCPHAHVARVAREGSTEGSISRLAPSGSARSRVGLIIDSGSSLRTPSSVKRMDCGGGDYLCDEVTVIARPVVWQ